MYSYTNIFIDNPIAIELLIYSSMNRPSTDEIIHKVALYPVCESLHFINHHILISKSNKDIFLLTSESEGRYTLGVLRTSTFEIDDFNRKASKKDLCGNASLRQSSVVIEQRT